MESLELKIPPPLVALIIAIAMWLASRIALPTAQGASWHHTTGLIIALFGAAIAALAIATFAFAKTTINPTTPGAATTLVTSGIFGISRNPMYLSLATILLGWATYLIVPFTYLGPVALVLYLDRFQIAPEERALKATFGTAYSDYCRRVRRWI